MAEWWKDWNAALELEMERALLLPSYLHHHHDCNYMQEEKEEDEEEEAAENELHVWSVRLWD